MRIKCVDHSRLGLAKLRRIIQQIVPEAEIFAFSTTPEMIQFFMGLEEKEF